ncbi:hypothetical protein C8Q80DRAFT_1196754 [Daedaleopsis nitida]|nr:hypothetical protein C8Q80DRAFT_1196754 [Daedaleopsis nitida]
MRIMRSLPGRVNEDIVDHIIDSLQDDPQGLSRFSLVCRYWWTRARRNLFGTIILPYSLDVGDYAIRNTATERRQLFHAILRKYPDIAPLVKNLCLTAVEEPGWDRWLDQHLTPLTYLKHVRCLAISRFWANSLLGIARAAVNTFPALEVLIIEEANLCTWRNGDDEPVSDPSPFLQPLYRTKTLTVLVLSEVISRTDDADIQVEISKLAKGLQAMGELSTLVRLELLGDPETSEAWIPFFPTVKATLQHLAVVINDVVAIEHMPRVLTEQQLQNKIATLYDAISVCSALRSLRIRFDAYPTFVREIMDHQRNRDPQTSPNPLISPYFLTALTAMLSREVEHPSPTSPGSPFPDLEGLEFHLVGSVECLGRCGRAWSALCQVLTAEGRFPRFRRLDIVLEEITSYCAETGVSMAYEAEGRAAEVKTILRAFEEAGVQVVVSVRKMPMVSTPK